MVTKHRAAASPQYSFRECSTRVLSTKDAQRTCCNNLFIKILTTAMLLQALRFSITNSCAGLETQGRFLDFERFKTLWLGIMAEA